MAKIPKRRFHNAKMIEDTGDDKALSHYNNIEMLP